MYGFAIIAAAATCYFAYQALQQPRPAVFVAAVLWLLYAIYEVWINPAADCVGGCNIRADLAVIFPVLLTATLFAVLSPAGRKVAGKIVLAVVAALVVFGLALEAYIQFVDKPAARRTRETEQMSPN